MKALTIFQRFSPLLHFILLGCVFEVLYLLVFALAPLSTTRPILSPSGMDWPWTLAPAQLLFHRASSLHGRYTDLAPYFFLLGLIFITLAGVYFYTVGKTFRTSNNIHITFRWLLLPLLGATIFGITLLLLPALFSNEVYSYMFSGRMLTIYHVDPLIAVPAQFQQDPYLRWIAQPNVATIYAPLWMAIASLLVGVGHSPVTTLLLFKGAALLSHLINCVLIWAILGKLAPSRRLGGTLLYAWNPLALIELAGNGDNDGALICLLLFITWLYVQQKGGWYDFWAVVLLGLAISVNFIALLFAPLFIWFSVHSEPGLYKSRARQGSKGRPPLGRAWGVPTFPLFPSGGRGSEALSQNLDSGQNLVHAIWGFCWRAIVALTIVFILYLPFWHGTSTFLAITSSIDMQHFVHSPLGVLAMPVRWLFGLLVQGMNLPTTISSYYLQPTSAADTAVSAAAMFIFALIYFYLLGKVRSFDTLLTSLCLVTLGYIVFISGQFWPWYVLWTLWIVALRRFDALTVSVLLLSCTALLTYPLLFVDNFPIASYQPLLIFGIPLIYLITHVKRSNERKTLPYDRRSETAKN